MATNKSITSLVILCSSAILVVPITAAPTLEWIDQFGTSENDYSFGVTADTFGNVYVSGYTEGSLEGTNAGSFDAFVRKYDANGLLLWTRQLGTRAADGSSSVSVDDSGSIYISGELQYGVFVSKFTDSGTLLWTEKLSTGSHDENAGVSVDRLGNVFFAGSTEGSLGGAWVGRYDAYIGKYNSDGVLLWIDQFGTNDDELSSGIAADGLGNVFITGTIIDSSSGGTTPDRDAFVRKYNSSGDLLWTTNLGAISSATSLDISSDGLGNAYISGSTSENLGGINAGGADAILSKFDGSGNLLWTQQLGTNSFDSASGVSTDGMGSVYISGTTDGSLEGVNAGNRDLFISKYNISGTLLWTEQLGTSKRDSGNGIFADALGNVFVTGSTHGSLEGLNTFGSDAFIIKFSEIPEPSSLLLITIGVAGLLMRRST